MAFSKIILTINKKHKLEMDVRDLDYTQTLYRARELSRMLKLGLRKVGAQPFMARRVIDKNGKRSWSYNTNIQMF